MSEKKTLVIDRSKWLRGDGCGTLLRESDGKMCCLGFDALARGLDPTAIIGYGEPIDVYDAPPEYVQWAQLHDIAITSAIRINDSMDLDAQERQAQLEPILRELGWDEVLFIDGAQA